MRGLRHAGWLPLAAAGLVLASILGFLYVRTQGLDSAIYFEHVALLRQIKQLDARWELDVLKARMRVTSNYDSLVDPLSDLTLLLDKLEAVVDDPERLHGAGLISGSADLRRAIRDKTRLIEDFKSHNAVLHNSLAFLPTAAADVEAAARVVADPAAVRALAPAVNHLLLDTMVYSNGPAQDRAAHMRTDLEGLRADSHRWPPELRDGVANFALHVGTVLREQPLVNDLIDRIARVPAALRIDDLHTLLNNEQRQTAEQVQRHRHYLLGFAAALVALLFYAATSLIRSHGVIQRVNLALQEANATLEQRVQKRTTELHAAQNELVETARHAGMAEVANNVLHNVGNVLNSVNVSAGMMAEQLRTSKASGLGKAAALLDSHSGDLAGFLSRDDRGRQLPAYLTGLSRALAVEQEALRGELAALTTSVDHIKDIVAAQQAYAGASSLVQPVMLNQLVEDALRINAGALVRHKVTVVNQLPRLPPLLLDKPRLMQILVNLISNAKHALDGVLDRPRRIFVGAEMADAADGRRCLQIRVADEGEGIRAEHLGQLFTHGFTTRKNGHGFGLHSCVVAAQEMGGSLRAYSAGPGQGATFTLELPAEVA